MLLKEIKGVTVAMEEFPIEIDESGAKRLKEILSQEHDEKLRIRIVASPG